MSRASAAMANGQLVARALAAREAPAHAPHAARRALRPASEPPLSARAGVAAPRGAAGRRGDVRERARARRGDARGAARVEEAPSAPGAPGDGRGPRASARPRPPSVALGAAAHSARARRPCSPRPRRRRRLVAARGRVDEGDEAREHPVDAADRRRERAPVGPQPERAPRTRGCLGDAAVGAVARGEHDGGDGRQQRERGRVGLLLGRSELGRAPQEGHQQLARRRALLRVDALPHAAAGLRRARARRARRRTRDANMSIRIAPTRGGCHPHPPHTHT